MVIASLNRDPTPRFAVCCFNDTNYFTYVFRTIVGCVPTRYRGK
ncbi:MAG: helix-turn-helix transcriptional regulator [Ruminococcaceae bacterium]|nr:helix-turn-helix transcriptional regulator [Oscillospiraceae bacterium]